MTRALLLTVMLLRACVPTAEAQSGPWTPHVLSHPYRGADGIDLYDVDGDGHQDLAVAWEAGRQLTVTRGGQPWHPLGAGTIAIDWAGGSRAYEDVRIDDWDGDQLPDYAGAAEGTGLGVHVFLSSLGYAYTRAKNSINHHWQTVTSCDITGNGQPDLLAAGAGVLWWWQARNASAGAWSQRQIATPGRALYIGCDDIDADGDLDVLWTDRLGSGLTWAENEPGGTWPQTVIAGGGASNIACAGDVDSDGDTDYVVPREDGTLAWYERGAAWLGHPIAVPWLTGSTTIAKGCAVADVDADGAPDLLVTLWDPDPLVTPGRVRLLRTWQAWETIDATVLKTDEPVVVDANGDGLLDVCVTDEGVSNSGPGGGLICLAAP